MQEERYIGLETAIIDQMYFSEEAARRKYLEEIHRLLHNLSIQNGDSRLDVLNKVGNAESNIPMLPDILAFSGFFQYSELSDRNKYYTLVKVCEFNIEQKHEFSEQNFDFEEQLFQRIVLIDLEGYAKLKLTFQVGELFSRLNVDEKRDFYFNLLRSTTFDISPSTVSEFYRAIGEIYLKSGNLEFGLDWLKAGIVLNPKLPVRKKIKELEKSNYQ